MLFSSQFIRNVEKSLKCAGTGLLKLTEVFQRHGGWQSQTLSFSLLECVKLNFCLQTYVKNLRIFETLMLASEDTSVWINNYPSPSDTPGATLTVHRIFHNSLNRSATPHWERKAIFSFS